MVKAAIDEAHKNGLKVAVHATERITARLSVESGADFLVHSVDDEPLDDAFVQLLKNRKTVFSPTLVVVGNYHKVFGQEYKVTEYDFKYAHPKQLNSVIDLKSIPDTNFTNRYKNYVRTVREVRNSEDELMRSNLKKLADGGVTIATGTDAGNIGTHHVSSYFDELKEMKRAGLDNWQLLQASTINAAKAVGKDSEFGSISSGKRADMLLLDKNPLDDIMNVNNVYRVINKGQIFEPDSIFTSSPEELVDLQLLAYNAHNLEAFLAPYAEDVEVYRFPNKLLTKGKEAMRKSYEFIETTPRLYCRLINRIVQGNMVIDQEEVWGFGDKPFYGLAIYEVKDGRIQKVYFPQ
ncbi:MAG: amidohydrolase family protein, partial [Flavisolibacter sp.]